MSERFRNAFQTLVERSPAPPEWEELVVPAPRRSRYRGPLIAVGAAAAVLTVVGVGVWLFPGVGGVGPAAAEIDFVRVGFSQQVTLVCEGGAVSDNGGFDEATIDVYGPNADDRWRVDVTFPTGVVQSFLYEGGPGVPLRAWQRPGGGPPDFAVPFRDAGCEYPNAEGSTIFGLVGPPIHAYRIPSEFLTTARVEPRSGRRVDLLDDLEAPGLATTRADTWGDVAVTVYVWERSFLDDVGRQVTTSTEWWIDPAARRVERTVDVGEYEGLGSWRSELAVLSRDRVAVPAELFDPAGMDLVVDMSQVEEQGSVSTTTSIAPLSEPLMDGAVPAEEGDLATSDLAAVADLREGDRLYRIPAPEGRSLFVRLRPGARPLLFATACDVLTSVELPEGWVGLCTERTVDGRRQTGVFSYPEAAGG